MFCFLFLRSFFLTESENSERLITTTAILAHLSSAKVKHLRLIPLRLPPNLYLPYLGWHLILLLGCGCPHFLPTGGHA